jgi:hypothetical protein
MRDGIFKDLPLGRSWRSLLKSCERPKERGETVQIKATRAVLSDLRNEIGGEFLHNLLDLGRRIDRLLPGFSCIDPDLTCRDLGGTNSPFENDVLKRTRRLAEGGKRGSELVYVALRDSIEQIKSCRVRQIEQHCLLKAGSKAGPIVNSAREALRSVDSSSIAEQLSSGGKMKTPSLKRPVDLNEDLTQVR